jgi:hypothetical protein
MHILLLLVVLFVNGCTLEFQEPSDVHDTTFEPTPAEQTPEETTMLDRNNQSKSGGWSASGTLLTKGKDAEVSLQANFGIAEYYTVQFGVKPDAGNDPPDATAEITWSVEGNFVRRVVSIGNGTSVSGTGQACAVKIRDTSQVNPAGQKYTASVQVSRGNRPGQTQPPFLRAVPSPGATDPYFIFILPGASADIAIPADAGVISADVEVVSKTNPPAIQPNEVLVEQTDSTAAVLFKAFYPLFDTGFVPVFPAAANLHIVNRSTTDTIGVSVLFGIDG